MTKSIEQHNHLVTKNNAVSKAYGNIVKDFNTLIQLFPSEQLRTFIQIDYPATDDVPGSKHFYTPSIYLSIVELNGELFIRYAKNFAIQSYLGRYLDTILVRSIYKHTSSLNKVNIEDRLEEYVFKYEVYKSALIQSHYDGDFKLTTLNYKLKEA